MTCGEIKVPKARCSRRPKERPGDYEANASTICRDSESSFQEELVKIMIPRPDLGSEGISWVGT